MATSENLVLTNLGLAFTKELKAIVIQVMAQHGVKKDSDLADSVEWKYNSESLQMVVSEYYSNVSKGRKPLQKKIPLPALIDFIKRNNISSTSSSITQLAFKMQRSIYLSGIKGKNFIEHVKNVVSDTVELKVADKLESLVANSLYAAFVVK